MVTGWFAEFGLLPSAGDASVVPYPDGPDRFAGASYDPSSHYRGAAVFDFFARQQLTVDLLRQVSQHQVGRLAAGFDALDLDPALITRDRSLPLAALGGFLALTSPARRRPGRRPPRPRRLHRRPRRHPPPRPRPLPMRRANRRVALNPGECLRGSILSGSG